DLRPRAGPAGPGGELPGACRRTGSVRGAGAAPDRMRFEIRGKPVMRVSPGAGRLDRRSSARVGSGGTGAWPRRLVFASGARAVPFPSAAVRRLRFTRFSGSRATARPELDEGGTKMPTNLYA